MKIGNESFNFEFNTRETFSKKIIQVNDSIFYVYNNTHNAQIRK